MAKIICPCAECKHHREDNICKANEIHLKYRSMITVHEGRVDMWVCDKYQLSEEAENIIKVTKEFFIKQSLEKMNTDICTDSIVKPEYWAGSLLRCPACGHEYIDAIECTNYCGNCGAKWDISGL